jgi:hypothetical protein
MVAGEGLLVAPKGSCSSSARRSSTASRTRRHDGSGWCRCAPRTRRLPIVVLTSSKEDRDLVESYDLGANSFVRKPVDFDQFLEAVRQLGLYWLVVNEAPPAGSEP